MRVKADYRKVIKWIFWTKYFTKRELCFIIFADILVLREPGIILTANMMQMIHKMLDWFKSLFWKEEMELTLVGLQHAGKTTFVNVIASGQFNEVGRKLRSAQDRVVNYFDVQDMIPTVGFNMRKITKGNVTIKLWDIGGQPRFRSMWERYCRGVNAIVYMVDAADPDKIEVRRWRLVGLVMMESSTF